MSAVASAFGAPLAKEECAGPGSQSPYRCLDLTHSRRQSPSEAPGSSRSRFSLSSAAPRNRPFGPSIKSMSYLRTVAIEPWKQSACSAAAGTLTLPSGPVRTQPAFPDGDFAPPLARVASPRRTVGLAERRLVRRLLPLVEFDRHDGQDGHPFGFVLESPGAAPRPRPRSGRDRRLVE